jgi:hypothetical protein
VQAGLDRFQVRPLAFDPAANAHRERAAVAGLRRVHLRDDVAGQRESHASIEVNRRARRAKTDRLDVGKLLTLLLRWRGGERRVWSVVHVPTPEAEAQRQLPREVATVREDRKRVRNRIQGLLATLDHPSATDPNA